MMKKIILTSFLASFLCLASAANTTANSVSSTATTTQTTTTTNNISSTAASTKTSSNAMVYSVEYAVNSPLKTVPLKNATLKVVIYYYGNPRGNISVITDDKQNFNVVTAFGKSAALDVVSIAEQNKYKAACYGTAPVGQTKILITCRANKK